MSLSATPSGERVHIGFFGVRNAGKSSVVNAVTGQDLAVVSDTKGTTTDPVKKAMELLPIGPVVIVDTPGIDDEGGLGALRVKRAKQALRSCDLAVLVVDATAGLSDADRELVAEFERRGIPHVQAWNKADLLVDGGPAAADDCGKVAGEMAKGSSDGDGGRSESAVAASASGDGGKLEDAAASAPGAKLFVSALTGEGIYELKELIGSFASGMQRQKRLVSDLLDEGDVVVLVMPIDESAPKGRIILPQQMVLRDVLDAHAAAFVCQPEELQGMLGALANPPRIVITDSQVFGAVSKVVPADVPLTSFSILMARYKGSLGTFVAGAAALSTLTESSRVLISEACTHHRQCEDIGTVKIPKWIEGHCGARPQFEFTSGGEFPDDLRDFDLVVHCGACMVNEKEMAHRVRTCKAAGVPIVNYGMAIAHMHGILERSLQPFAE